MLGAVGRVGSVGRTGVKAGPGAPAGKTYADWVAHVSSVTATTRSWDGYQSHASSGLNRVTCGAVDATKRMYGSIWGALAAFFSFTPSAAVQHGLPSQAVYNEQCANSRPILYYAQYDGGFSGAACQSVDRNGYQSIADPATPTIYLTEVSWWDASLGRPRTCNPYFSGAVTDYAARGWTN